MGFMKWKVACVQLNSQIGQIETNIANVRKILTLVKDVDLVILPELAITGYNFASKQAILPYLENQETGGSSINLAKEISQKYKCFTLIGYPESNQNKIYNSAILIAPNGESIYNYRKTFLYSADEVWGCEENPEKDFKSFKLVLDKDYYFNKTRSSWRSITTNIGICMDLNPYKFEAKFNEFEFSQSCFLQHAKLILCPMAWLSPLSPDIDKSIDPKDLPSKSKVFEKYFDYENRITVNESGEPSLSDSEDFIPRAPNSSTIKYWILRFLPFINHPGSYPSKYYKKVNLIACNRSGQESNTVYTGSTLIIEFDSTKGQSHDVDNDNPSVDVLGSLGQGDEGVLLREIELEVDE